MLSPLSYKPCYAKFYVGKIRRIRIGSSDAAATRGFRILLFSHNNFVGLGGTSSALPVDFVFQLKRTGIVNGIIN